MKKSSKSAQNEFSTTAENSINNSLCQETPSLVKPITDIFVYKKNYLHHDAELSGETKSHISDSLMPEMRLGTPPKSPSMDGSNEANYERRISEFFKESRADTAFPVKAFSFWKLSKGLILGIVFIIFFASIILWIVFSSDNFEHDEKLVKHLFKSINCTASDDFHLKSNCTYVQKNKFYWSHNFFILFSTILIVISIIVFVFVSASCRHFCQKSKYSASSSSVFTSIFRQQNKRDSLYYLEKNEQMHQEKLNQKKSANSLNSTSDLNRLSNLNNLEKSSSFNNDDSKPKRLDVPVIVFNDSGKFS